MKVNLSNLAKLIAGSVLVGIISPLVFGENSMYPAFIGGFAVALLFPILERR